MQSGKKNTIGDKTINIIHGEQMKNKSPHDTHILLCNINTMPHNNNNVKKDICRDIATNDFDIKLLNEINKDQRALNQQDRTGEIVKNWWQRTICRDEYLIDDGVKATNGARQQGGVATIINNDTINLVIDQGGDKRKLGRCRWVTIRGKRNVRTTIITSYHPEKGWITQDNQLAAI